MNRRTKRIAAFSLHPMDAPYMRLLAGAEKARRIVCRDLVFCIGTQEVDHANRSPGTLAA